jgi:hypothetical protein
MEGMAIWEKRIHLVEPIDAAYRKVQHHDMMLMLHDPAFVVTSDKVASGSDSDRYGYPQTRNTSKQMDREADLLPEETVQQ